MENMINIPQEIKDKAIRLSAIKGSRFTVEQNIDMLMNEAAKKAKSMKKNWKKRDSESAVKEQVAANPMQHDDYADMRKKQMNASKSW